MGIFWNYTIFALTSLLQKKKIIMFLRKEYSLGLFKSMLRQGKL